MPVDYIHYILPSWEITLLGNLPTFFYFEITLLPLKKKVLQTSRHFISFVSFYFSGFFWEETRIKASNLLAHLLTEEFSLSFKKGVASFCVYGKNGASFVKTQQSPHEQQQARRRNQVVRGYADEAFSG